MWQYFFYGTDSVNTDAVAERVMAEFESYHYRNGSSPDPSWNALLQDLMPSSVQDRVQVHHIELFNLYSDREGILLDHFITGKSRQGAEELKEKLSALGYRVSNDGELRIKARRLSF